MLVRPQQREYRTWVMDSRRWEHFRPRAGDVIVTTYPKCGTTWMQRIVNLLIFQSPDPRPVSKLSPWYEMRVGVRVDVMNEALEAQIHRRAVKSHLPFDGLPLYDEVRYIHVARDGRDACLSFHNHGTGFTSEMLGRLDKAGLEDPQIAKPFPRLPSDPADYFHLWLTTSHLRDYTDGYQNVSFFEFQKSYWVERMRPNVLMVHYADLKHNLETEMRRVAAFLEVEVAEELWPRLVQAASFQTMKDQGDQLMPQVTALFEGGSERFFYKGRNGRWKDIFRTDDLTLYDAKLNGILTPACAKWLEEGRCGSGVLALAEP